ncbi:LOW QUALITY PROTEIN: ankyrin repeat and IBR domain-containing protein 1 [Lethenteron reissneri]|uniref:LOW QUALITY PROTEIN: ankyrin repeat and IBR domain-containing protein 1 n=1 Tax=Lethenteron reissneri TaxID=7753 RepID=UPI002AB7E427|nr:LOW QUALITY PROTEIN: ankyrin repeat and IBR domain-containing protein 1 [Lethenteron reissneri]
MGSASTKFRKALQAGDEGLALQLYYTNVPLAQQLDPNASYGEAYDNNTAMHYATRHAMPRLLSVFLREKEGNPNKRNGLEETALHCACTPLAVLIVPPSGQQEERRLLCLRMLLDWQGPLLGPQQRERTKIDARDHHGNTPLHYAACSGMKRCVELLVVRGASLFVENEDGATPCDRAEINRHYEVALHLESRMVLAQDYPDGDGDESQEPLAHGCREPFEGLRAQELRELKDLLIVETADMLQVPLFTAEALLRSHGWDRERLLEAWMLNSDECCQRSGVQPPPPPPTGQNSWGTIPDSRPPLRSPITPPGDLRHGLSTCEICLGRMPESDPVDVPCGHLFCKKCWEEYLNMKIQEGKAHSILCPAYDCYSLVPIETIEVLVCREMARRYLQFDIKAFVDTNPSIRWCPVPRCEQAVRLALPSAAGGSAVRAHTPTAVDCGSGHTFCWECLGEAHEPCDCDTWKQWLQKIVDMKPEELSGVSVAAEDAANCLWLISNSKPCPSCKSPIQKNDGCNHMQCTKCKHDFCWICLEEWKKHSSSTGGYYRCTRYEVIQAVEDSSRDVANEAEKKHKKFQELDRFMHYYSRFKNHEHSYKLELPLLQTARAKMEILRSALENMEGVDTSFIEHAVQELLKTRRVLRGSYGYGYFLEPHSTQKDIFELMQMDLEMLTEDLAQKVNRPYLRTPRQKIVRAARLAQQKRQEFLASVARGVAPPDSPPSSRRLVGRPWEWEFLGFSSPEEYEEVLERRRRRSRRGDPRSSHSHLTDPGLREESSTDSPLSGRRARRMESSRSFSHVSSLSLPEYSPPSLPRLRRSHVPPGFLEEEDADMLLAIQLSLQELEPAHPPAPPGLSPSASPGPSDGTDAWPDGGARLSSSFPLTSMPWPQTTASTPSHVWTEMKAAAAASAEAAAVRDDYSLEFGSAEGSLGGSATVAEDLAAGGGSDLLDNLLAWFHDTHSQHLASIPTLGAAAGELSPGSPESRALPRAAARAEQQPSQGAAAAAVTAAAAREGPEVGLEEPYADEWEYSASLQLGGGGSDPEARLAPARTSSPSSDPDLALILLRLQDQKNK